MSTRREFLKQLGFGIAAAAVGTPLISSAAERVSAKPIDTSGPVLGPQMRLRRGDAVTMIDGKYVSQRPPVAKRHFTSKAVEETIATVKKEITDPKLAWMFENCFPNTLDTTVEYRTRDGRPDTFVITGDINAMWLRDSAAQVWPYIELCQNDEPLKNLIAGVINRQTFCIKLDRYANAFTNGSESSEWKTDMTEMKPFIHERKWEIDSLCYPVRLAYNYWKKTGDTSVFDEDWKYAMNLIITTFREQQRKDNVGPYKFQRRTERQLDTLSNNGLGHRVKGVGLIVSSFRPSDDATLFGFLIPSNLFAVVSLRQMAEISEQVTMDMEFATVCREFANEVEAAVKKYAIVKHPKYGKIYAFETDGFGNELLMDDANIPSLLALPYLGCMPVKDPIYQNTREFVWSLDNPYFFKGTAAEGIGGPHIGYDMIWPMSIIMKAQTASSDEEIRWCLRTLRDTDAGTGFMHESFNMDDPDEFTRSWFAWVNTLFGELIVKLYNQGKIGLLNNL